MKPDLETSQLHNDSDGTTKVAPRGISPKLLRLCSEARERRKLEDEKQIVIVGLRYPTGRVPSVGIAMCKEYLRETYPEDCGRDFVWLNLVEGNPDDTHWSLNGEVQGKVFDLIQWITGCSWREGLSDIINDFELWHSGIEHYAQESARRRMIDPQEQATR